MRDIYSAAEEIDSMTDRASAFRAMRREAQAHGHKARIVGMPTIVCDAKGNNVLTHVPAHVLVVSPDGEVRIFTSAADLADWLGY